MVAWPTDACFTTPKRVPLLDTMHLSFAPYAGPLAVEVICRQLNHFPNLVDQRDDVPGGVKDYIRASCRQALLRLNKFAVPTEIPKEYANYVGIPARHSMIQSHRKEWETSITTELIPYPALWQCDGDAEFPMHHMEALIALVSGLHNEPVSPMAAHAIASGGVLPATIRLAPENAANEATTANRPSLDSFRKVFDQTTATPTWPTTIHVDLPSMAEAEPTQDVAEGEPMQEGPEAEPMDEVSVGERMDDVPEGEAMDHVPESERPCVALDEGDPDRFDSVRQYDEQVSSGVDEQVSSGVDESDEQNHMARTGLGGKDESIDLDGDDKRVYHEGCCAMPILSQTRVYSGHCAANHSCGKLEILDYGTQSPTLGHLADGQYLVAVVAPMNVTTIGTDKLTIATIDVRHFHPYATE
jgi:hypothetical protein